MFEQSLVISSRQPIRSQRQWSTAAAASLEALVLSVLAVYPLLHPAALPQITSPRAPAPIFSATQPEPAHTGAASHSNAGPPSARSSSSVGARSARAISGGSCAGRRTKSSSG